MNVYYNGKVPNSFVVESFVNSVVKHLKINRLKRDIEINFVDHIDSGRTWGVCYGDSDSVVIEVARKDLERKRSFMELMITLGHELVHARQFLRGELKTVNGNNVWKNQLFEKFTYKTAPWEIEAHEAEGPLMLQCFPFHLPFKN